jgi:glycosyltransferase involved in cell wall biosynthesis
VATRGWCTSIAAAGAEVELLVDRGTRRIPCPQEITCSAVTHLGTHEVGWPIGLKRKLWGKDVFVVHAGLRPHTALAARRAHHFSTPYIVSTHGIYLRGALARRAWWKRASIVLFEASYLSRAAGVHVYFDEEIAGLPPGGVDRKLIVAHPGVTVPPGAKWDGGSGGYLLWLGRFDVYQKGLDLLIDGLAHMPESDRPRLRLIGTEWRGQRARLRQEVIQRGLLPWITVEGPIYGEEKWATLAAANGFVYPSRYEAFGMALAEAAAMGVPCLATPFGLSRLLASRGAALLVGTAEDEIAASLLKLTSSPGRQAGGRALEVSAELLSWAQAGTSFLSQARNLLG